MVREAHKTTGRVLVFGPEALLSSLLEFVVVVTSLTTLGVVGVSLFFKVLSGAFWESELFVAVNAGKNNRFSFGGWSFASGGRRTSAGNTLCHFSPREVWLGFVFVLPNVSAF
ncbi:MAG: hypothetical protein G01um101420_28 [Parcubacteria group bacterium Gr01-1014_20]|nr:MAG: hypothetical protein G01um101420_28 [Parcubacteria group bacterium Gr01-1014_20]